MTLLRAIAINACLSLATIVCLFKLIESEYISTDYWTTTSTTLRPFTRTPGLSLPIPSVHPPKCYREVPAVFFQVEKDVPITGNSTDNPYMNVIQVCCDGYKRYDFDWSKCVPDCGEKCQNNGFCVAGSICQCFDEFVLNHRNECVSTCPLGCPNGQCYLNGTCVCNKGYELDPTLKYCIPQCEKGCGHNEVCEEPNKCVCAEGYAKSNSLNSALGCQPICLPDCGYGHCVAPNECACFPGYRKRANGTSCTADCYMRCDNGFCANRTSCICQNGYRYDINTTSCLPDCGDNCENGVCIQPGVCRCFNGYVHDGITCKAICEHGCGFYGKCIGHNVCGCAIVDGPFSSYQQCSLGNCNGVGRCRCQEGTTRFLNQCLSPDRVTTYGSMRHQRLNETFLAEFQLLIGRHFMFLRNSTFYDDLARYQHHTGNGGYRYNY